jgi:outer membrane biosynthesis protein TonB
MSSQKNVSNDEVEEQGNLLSSQERQAFKMISAGDDLHGQRAVALLAIDEGATQKEAGIRSGLTPGQVKYWLGRFRQLRLEIFPDQVLENAGLEPGTPQPGTAQEPEQVTEKTRKPVKKKKAKDTKKKQTKKAKKKKKDKAASKKGKKTKKKGKDSTKKEIKSNKKKGNTR